MRTRSSTGFSLHLQLGLALLAIGCSSLPEGIHSLDSALLPDQSWHRGPEVAIDDTGTARFASLFATEIDKEGIVDLVEFSDGMVKAPASLGFDQLLDRLADELREMGFDDTAGGLRLEFLARPPVTPGWTPLRASVALVDGNGVQKKLHAFGKESHLDRAILPLGALQCDLTAPIARSLSQLDPGEILVTAVNVRQVVDRARSRGAVAVVSASLSPYNQDPSGDERHLDAVQVRVLRMPSTLPTFQISNRSLATIDEAYDAAKERVDAEPVRLSLKSEVVNEQRPLRTLVATVVGERYPEQAVVITAHAQGPGAVNNASGVAGVLEGLRVLSRGLESGQLKRPDRSVVFLFGDELRHVEDWLEKTELKPIAAICADMIGSRTDSGAIALLEREPDPGAWRMLEPDESSSWGGGDRKLGTWSPSGLSIVARSGMVDVGLLEEGWPCADHPWEGGSDHDVFLEAGVPAVLFWHFTDFTYHTSLDRVDAVDPHETRRTAAAVMCTALALASPAPADLDRYLRSLDLEIALRVKAAAAEGDAELQAEWSKWSRGARRWLRNLCLGIDEPLPVDLDVVPIPSEL